MNLCARADCPVEQDRRAMEAYRAENIAKGAAPSWSENDYVVTCRLCGQLKGWTRASDGSEREIPHHVLWGHDAGR